MKLKISEFSDFDRISEFARISELGEISEFGKGDFSVFANKLSSLRSQSCQMRLLEQIFQHCVCRVLNCRWAVKKEMRKKVNSMYE